MNSKYYSCMVSYARTHAHGDACLWSIMSYDEQSHEPGGAAEGIHSESVDFEQQQGGTLL